MRTFVIASVAAFAVTVSLPAAETLCSSGFPCDRPLNAATLTNVAVTGGFWLSRIETNRTATIPCGFVRCEETGRLDNFRKAARREKGTFKGIPYDDSDVYKVIEGASYSLAVHPDPKLDARLDSLIDEIAKAQEPDGYLYTARTLGMEQVPDYPRARMMGPQRWSNTDFSHEFYNMGHLIEAGVAHWQATGKRKLVDVAIRAADMFDRTFGYGPGQIMRLSGHEEIELALCKLARATGELRYVALARRLADFRGRGGSRKAYMQSHEPVVSQREAVGHAVRAGYLYSAMVDIATMQNDSGYRAAVDAIWHDVVGTKMHITGGVGAYKKITIPPFGAMGEAFGPAYDLPNESAYLETCAAIANALWNWRLFLASGDGRYMDVFERIAYNGFLSGVSVSGTEFFYENPLASSGRHVRQKWFGTSCCPVNVMRFMPQIPSAAYSYAGNSVYVNLYIESIVRLPVESGAVCISTHTDYPWDGKIVFKIEECAEGQRFALKQRIPGWVRGNPVPSDLYAQVDQSHASDARLSVNGETVRYSICRGYATLDRAWRRGDRIVLEFPMKARFVRANANVKADKGCLAVERGPVVFCAESMDNATPLADMHVSVRDSVLERFMSVAGERVVTIRLEGERRHVEMIPYFAWCNRGAGEMRVWLRELLADRGVN